MAIVMVGEHTFAPNKALALAFDEKTGKDVPVMLDLPEGMRQQLEHLAVSNDPSDVHTYKLLCACIQATHEHCVHLAGVGTLVKNVRITSHYIGENDRILKIQTHQV